MGKDKKWCAGCGKGTEKEERQTCKHCGNTEWSSIKRQVSTKPISPADTESSAGVGDDPRPPSVAPSEISAPPTPAATDLPSRRPSDPADPSDVETLFEKLLDEMALPAAGRARMRGLDLAKKRELLQQQGELLGPNAPSGRAMAAARVKKGAPPPAGGHPVGGLSPEDFRMQLDPEFVGEVRVEVLLSLKVALGTRPERESFLPAPREHADGERRGSATDAMLRSGKVARKTHPHGPSDRRSPSACPDESVEKGTAALGGLNGSRSCWS